MLLQTPVMSSSEIQAEPSIGSADGHEDGSGPEAQPARQSDDISDEKKLRALMRQKGVDSTTALVRIYNGSLAAEAERLLQQCLRIYIETKEKHANDDTVMEFVELCKMKPRTEDDKKLLREVVSFLTDRIPEREFAAKSVAEALYRSLLWTPPAVLQENLTGLTALADRLMDSLCPTPRLTEENFLEHEAIFMALHEVFVLMQRATSKKVTVEEKKRFQSSLRAKRSSLGNSCEYYPVRYYFRLIEQSIQLPKLDEEPCITQKTIQCLYIITCGFLYISYAKRQRVKLDIDPDMLRELPEKLNELVDDIELAERQWYDLLQALCVAGRKTIEDPQKLPIFEESYKTVEESVWKMRLNEDGKALLFGLMQELRHLALAQCSAEVRASGSSKLFALAAAVSKSTWARDKNIVEALLCCLHAIHSRGSDAAAALRSSQQLKNSVKLKSVKKVVKQWMGDKLDEKLREPVHASSEPTGDLFTAIGREFNHIPLKEAQDNVELLKSRYRSDAFATVRLYFHHVFLFTESLCIEGAFSVRQYVTSACEGNGASYCFLPDRGGQEGIIETVRFASEQRRPVHWTESCEAHRVEGPLQEESRAGESSCSGYPNDFVSWDAGIREDMHQQAHRVYVGNGSDVRRIQSRVRPTG